MGFGDKLKALRDQAESAVAENKDKITGAVQTVGEAANNKTKGKYADKIAKVGEKVTTSVEKMGGAEESEAAQSETPVADTAFAEAPAAPEAPVQSEPAQPAGAPPSFDE